MFEVGDIVAYRSSNKRIGIIERSISGRLKVRYILLNDGPHTKLSHYYWQYESLISDKIANDAIDGDWIMAGV